MIRFIYGANLFLEPELAKSMFRDRAHQFSRRLGWTVHVDEVGMERDGYDRMNPLYVIATDNNGEHLGSMRFLPTIGRTMLNDHFRRFYEGPDICDARVWECTRFCLAPSAKPRVALRLLAAGASLMKEFDLRQLVAVFDHKMERVYRRSHVSPHTLGTGVYEGGSISVGQWNYSWDTHAKLLAAAGIGWEEMELYLVNSDVHHDLRQYA